RAAMPQEPDMSTSGVRPGLRTRGPGHASGIMARLGWGVHPARFRWREPAAELRGGAVWNLGRQYWHVVAHALHHYGHSGGFSSALALWRSEALGRHSCLWSVSW